MTKAEIVAEISKKTGIEKNAVLMVVEGVMESIRESLANNENVYLRGFGTFEVIRRNEKMARNISKGETVVVPAHNIPKFKPCKEFKEKIK